MDFPNGQRFCLWWSKMRFRVRTIRNFNYSLGIYKPHSYFYKELATDWVALVALWNVSWVFLAQLCSLWNAGASEPLSASLALFCLPIPAPSHALLRLFLSKMTWNDLLLGTRRDSTDNKRVGGGVGTALAGSSEPQRGAGEGGTASIWRQTLLHFFFFFWPCISCN